MTTLSVDVPYAANNGGADSPNGAITELGLAQGAGETHQARKRTFFLENVSLTGRFEVIVTDGEPLGALRVPRRDDHRQRHAARLGPRPELRRRAPPEPPARRCC